MTEIPAIKEITDHKIRETCGSLQNMKHDDEVTN